MRFVKYCLWEFHYSRFCLFYKSWKAFAYTPWLPQSWRWQWMFLIYRWITAIFFLVWLFLAGFQSGGPKYFIFLTNWANLLWSAYLIWAAIFVSVAYFRVVYLLLSGRGDGSSDHAIHCTHQFLVDDRPAGCCGAGEDQIFWHQKISWLLFNLSSGMVIGVVILYWTLIYDPDVELGGVNIVTHLVAGTVAVMEVWLTGVPMRLLHMVYLVVFGAAYSIFSGIYFAADGTNHSDEPYIYSVIDYGSNPVSSTVTVLLVVLVFLPVVYLLLYAQFLLREAALYLRNQYCCKKLSSADDNSIRMEGLVSDSVLASI